MTNAVQVIETAVALPERADDLALIDLARRALAEAKTLPDIRVIRDQAIALKSYAKARGLGIEAENSAAEIRVRAERMMGAELIRMAEAGERVTRQTSGTFYREVGANGRLPTREDLGLNTHQVGDWQKLARLDDPSFEAVVTRAKESGGRLARLDFVRAAADILGDDEPDDPPPVAPSVTGGDPGDAWSATWTRVRATLASLQEQLDLGWPVRTDRDNWAEVNEQVSVAGRTLLHFQSRVRSFLNG